jgi:hypothetical protein
VFLWVSQFGCLEKSSHLPALGLSSPPWRYAVRDHVNALVSHLVFGITTGAVTAGITLRICGRVAVDTS